MSRHLPFVTYKNNTGKDVNVDVVSRLLSLGVIFISETITQETVVYFLACVYHLINDLELSKVTIIINSYGGDAYSGVAISDMMRYCFSNVVFETYCIGFAGSAASIIHVAGHYRKMTKYSRLMIHQPRVREMGGAARDIQTQSKELTTLEEIIIEKYVLACKGKKDAAYFRLIMSNDAFFSAEDALDVGLCDEILFKENLGEISRLIGQIYGKEKVR